MFHGSYVLLYVAIHPDTKTALENSTISVQLVHRTEDVKTKYVKIISS